MFEKRIFPGDFLIHGGVKQWLRFDPDEPLWGMPEQTNTPYVLVGETMLVLATRGEDWLFVMLSNRPTIAWIHKAGQQILL